MRSFMNRSSTTILSARDMLLFNSVPSIFAATESALSQPAAMASSGFKSITQKIKCPPFMRVNIDASHEISGGEVSTTTASWRRVTARRQPTRQGEAGKVQHPFPYLCLSHADRAQPYD